MQTNTTWWPTADFSEPPVDVVAVSVNYNTPRLVAQLLWSLHRFIRQRLHSVVIVDNGSTDGSLPLLRAAAEAGLCRLVANPHNRGHGPALSQAMSYLAERQPAQQAARPWIWLLDSDCLVARPDAAEKAIAAMTQARAALAGEQHWNEWHAQPRFLGCSLLLDPARTWRAQLGGFKDGGDPIGEFERLCRQGGVTACSFPFTAQGYLIHLGRGTLAGVRSREERLHPLFGWAQDHYAPHFQQVPEAPERYAAILQEFDRQVPDMQPDQLIRACRRG